MTLQRFLFALSVVVLTATGAAPNRAVAADYDIDIPGMHAAIQFRILHLGYSVLTGRFNDFGGTFTWDKDNPGASTINVTIKTASIDSNHAERDKHLREGRFSQCGEIPGGDFRQHPLQRGRQRRQAGGDPHPARR